MKTIGLLGGMSWESTELYYRLINQGIKALGGLHSAHRPGERGLPGDRGATAHRRLGTVRRGAGPDRPPGASCGRRLPPALHQYHAQGRPSDRSAAIDIPFLHLADATAQRIRAEGLQTVGLLGTAPVVMEQDFYRGRLAHHGLEVRPRRRRTGG